MKQHLHGAACVLLAVCGWVVASHVPAHARADAPAFNFYVTESIAGWRWPDQLSLADATEMGIDMMVRGIMELPSQAAVDRVLRHIAPDGRGPGGGPMSPFLLNLNASLTQRGEHSPGSQPCRI
jgi:hypothetical protein